MFDHASGRADRHHRLFFQSSGELCQVWAQRADGSLLYLAEDAVDDQIRADAHAGQLTCPYPGCPDPRFIARGGAIRRHHFAHKIAGANHNAAAGWRHQALLMLAEWAHRRYPQIETEIDNEHGTLRLRSPRTSRQIALAVTYSPRHHPTGDAQLLLGHSRQLLLPRSQGSGPPEQWWCGKGRLLGEMLHRAGWALAVNPQERLIATLVRANVASHAGLAKGRIRGQVLCVVADLDNARLDETGIHTSASDRAGRAFQTIKAAQAACEAAEAKRRLEIQRLNAQAEAARTRAAEQQASVRARITSLQRHAPDAHEPPVSRSEIRTDDDWRPHEYDWPLELDALRKQLNDENLARKLEQPLPTDVDCGQPAAVWHLIAALEYRNRNYKAHPLAIRAALTGNGCSTHLTRDAIEPILAIVDAARQ